MSSQNTFKMVVLPFKPAGVTIFSKDTFPQEKKMTPFVVGGGTLDFICGKCDHIILKSLRWRQVTKAVYKCPKCGAYNQIEQTAGKH